MPLYNYSCPDCNHNFEVINKICDRGCNRCLKCGNMARQAISRKPAAVHGFKLGWFEHIDIKPVYAKSKKHLRELCDQYDSYAPGVLD